MRKKTLTERLLEAVERCPVEALAGGALLSAMLCAAAAGAALAEDPALAESRAGYRAEVRRVLTDLAASPSRP